MQCPSLFLTHVAAFEQNETHAEMSFREAFVGPFQVPVRFADVPGGALSLQQHDREVALRL